MRFSRSSRDALSRGCPYGSWLVLSALLLVALLLPPLLLPLLLLVLPADPLLSSLRLPWALAQAPAAEAPSHPRALRGPPQL